MLVSPASYEQNFAMVQETLEILHICHQSLQILHPKHWCSVSTACD